MARLGVFGGSFNPIHEGHISFLQQVKSQLNLDKIILLVCKNAAHKNVNLASLHDRVKMCEAATFGVQNVVVSDLEFEIDKNGRSVQTLQKIKSQHPNDELFLIVGPDSFLKINTWQKFSLILSLAKIVSGYSGADDFAEMEKLALRFNFKPVLLKINLKPFHSVKVRIRLAQGLDCKAYLNSDVYNFILKNKIYSNNGANVLISECENACKNMVSKTRFVHCSLVSKMAVQLAKAYGENVYDARIAGLLHDIVKEQSPEFLAKILKSDNSFRLDEWTKLNHKLWHAAAGAIYCKNVLGLEKAQVLSAIACHTTGKKNMTTLEKIVYVSDNVSLDRKSLNAKIERRMAFKNLDKTLLFHLKNHFQVCCKKNLVLLSDSIECYNQLISKLRFHKT